MVRHQEPVVVGQGRGWACRRYGQGPSMVVGDGRTGGMGATLERAPTRKMTDYTSLQSHGWSCLGMKTVWTFSDRIRDQIRLERFRFIRIRVWIFNIWYHIHIRILKSYIYDIDIHSYLMQHDWHYAYLNPNPTRNMKTNMISVISVRIRSIFIPNRALMDPYNCIKPF